MTSGRAEMVVSSADPVQGSKGPNHSVVQSATTIKRSVGEKKSRIQLAGLRIEKSASFPLPHDQTIEVENNVRNTALSLLRLTRKDPYDHSDVTRWEVVLTSRITAVTACDFISAVVTEDNFLSVFTTKTGRRLHLPILLNSPVSRIDSSHHYLMLITIDGRISVYDFNSHTSVVRNESLVPLLSDSGNRDSSSTCTTTHSGNRDSSSTCTITHSEITANGAPVISLSNKKSFIFDPCFKHWSLLSNPTDLLSNCSSLRPVGYRSDPDSYPLARIQGINSRGIRPGTNTLTSNSPLLSKATISFIDQQLAASFVVGSKAEYKFWLLSLAQALTDEGREDRLRELSSFLLGPVFQATRIPTSGHFSGSSQAIGSEEESWSPTILGHDKRSLLNEVLLIMTSNLRLQRLYTELKDQVSFSNLISSDPITNSCFGNRMMKESNPINPVLPSTTASVTSNSINPVLPSTTASVTSNSIRQDVVMNPAHAGSNFITLNHAVDTRSSQDVSPMETSERKVGGNPIVSTVCVSSNGERKVGGNPIVSTVCVSSNGIGTHEATRIEEVIVSSHNQQSEQRTTLSSTPPTLSTQRKTEGGGGRNREAQCGEGNQSESVRSPPSSPSPHSSLSPIPSVMMVQSSSRLSSSQRLNQLDPIVEDVGMEPIVPDTGMEQENVTKSHSPTLENHSPTLENHSPTLENHSSTLENHSSTLENHES